MKQIFGVYRAFFNQILSRINPETVHNLVVRLGRILQRSRVANNLLSRNFAFSHPALSSTVWDIFFENPVGLAAGFDKNAQIVDVLFSFGFGFVEVGSVTAQRSDGNPKPRLFRQIEERAILNRMGLNNLGADTVYKNTIQTRKHPVGINIAKTNDLQLLGKQSIEDMLYTYKKFSTIADYLVLNLSCPNTKDGKTFEEEQPLRMLLTAIQNCRSSKPLLVKISPNLSPQNLEKIVESSINFSIDGFIISNTLSTERGGLSGIPLQKDSTKTIRRVYQQTDGKKPIIGVGGINSAESAYEKIKSGASLIQIYTGLIFQGPNLIKKINKGLVKLLRDDGFSCIAHAVGTDAK